MEPVLAIDPGVTGAIAVAYRSHVVTADMPTYKVRKATRVNLHELAAKLTEFRDTLDVRAAVVEHVGAMPRQGVSSAFNFGFTTGAIHGILAALGFEAHTVTPAQWKFGVGLKPDPDADKHARKACSRARAIELFPDYAYLFARAKDDGRAEAALMAWWFANKRKG